MVWRVLELPCLRFSSMKWGVGGRRGEGTVEYDTPDEKPPPIAKPS